MTVQPMEAIGIRRAARAQVHPVVINRGLVIAIATVEHGTQTCAFATILNIIMAEAPRITANTSAPTITPLLVPMARTGSINIRERIVTRRGATTTRAQREVKRIMSHQNLLRLILILLPLVTTAALLTRVAVPQTTPNPISLRLRAGPSGNYVSYAQPNIFPSYADLNQLGLASTDVITGLVGDNICKLSADESSITTDFDVTVQTVYKGGLIPGSTIKVSVIGGRLAFKQLDGSLATAEIRAPWFKKMSAASQYYFFLTGSSVIQGQQAQPLKPTGGPQGVFEIANGVITSNSGRLRDPMWQYNNVAVAIFQVSVQGASSPPVENPSPMLPNP